MSALPDRSILPASLWYCPMCSAVNSLAQMTCRVCRTSADGKRTVLPHTLEEDTFTPAPFLHVIPFVVGILVIGVFAATHVPKASTWAGGPAPGGWQVGVRVNRAQELRIAVRDLRVLVEEYQQAIAVGVQPNLDWSQRVVTLRTTWEIYGNGTRFPGLEEPEVELASAVQELASLRASSQSENRPDAEIDRGLRSVLALIQKTEESLANVE